MKFLLVLLVPLSLFSSQLKCKREVYSIAKLYTNYPTTIVAIAMTESSCGLHLLGDDSKSLGIMQMQIPTARDVIRWNPKELGYLSRLTTPRLRTVLLSNTYIQVKMATLLFEHHRRRHGYKKAVSLYNGGMHNTVYFNRVEKWKRKLQ
jgi:hypothetical protein